MLIDPPADTPWGLDKRHSTVKAALAFQPYWLRLAWPPCYTGQQAMPLYRTIFLKPFQWIVMDLGCSCEMLPTLKLTFEALHVKIYKGAHSLFLHKKEQVGNFLSVEKSHHTHRFLWMFCVRTGGPHRCADLMAICFDTVLQLHIFIVGCGFNLQVFLRRHVMKKWQKI